jgi:hypothetical protein
VRAGTIALVTLVLAAAAGGEHELAIHGPPPPGAKTGP